MVGMDNGRDRARLGLAVALPLHYMGRFNYDWVSHLGRFTLGRSLRCRGCGGVIG